MWALRGSTYNNCYVLCHGARKSGVIVVVVEAQDSLTCPRFHAAFVPHDREDLRDFIKVEAHQGHVRRCNLTS